MHENITIRGARQHNLKNVDVVIPRDKLVVITGVSGSGKSSLAFDTLFAEGQRRYVESLSAYARQFLTQTEKPEVDTIEGLSPAISIEQKTTSANPRSTVGTVTEIHDYLRLAYASIGLAICPDCNTPIEAATVQQMVDRLLELEEGRRFQVLAPLIRGRKGVHGKIFEQLRREGFVRARVDGEVHSLDGEPPQLDPKRKHDIEVVVDRLKVDPGGVSRLAASLELALNVGDGLVIIDLGSEELVLSSRHACATCGFAIAEISPRLFSFNSPFGACPACAGIGFLREVDPELLVVEPEASLNDGAIEMLRPGSNKWLRRQLEALGKALGFSLSTPWCELKGSQRHAILFGNESELDISVRGRRSHFRYQTRWAGHIARLDKRYQETSSQSVRAGIERIMAELDCRSCGGHRLRPESLAIKLGGINIAELSAMTVGDAARFFASLDLGERELKIAGKVLREIEDRLGFLVNVGLDYLSLERMAGTLSGGESQRIRLATQVGSKLMGVLYVLDEPSIGLHQRDNARLLETLVGMRDLGNTVVVVEHDEETIQRADWVIDLGPGAGRLGGEVVAEGVPAAISACERSLTGAYLCGRRMIEIPLDRRPGNGEELVVRGARENNLKNIDVAFPLGCFIAVTGVSGSGKSSLVNQILRRAAARALHDAGTRPGAHDRLEGLELLDKVVAIDQKPIGRTPRSNPATYTKIFDPIRELLAGTEEARARGYAPGRFSFNVKGGRCEACQGAGAVRIEMHFLPDVFVTCEVCRGKRYNRETLEVHYKGLDVSEILDLTVDDAAELFAAVPRLLRGLETLRAVGLGYIHLGQSATTLSGGEAQRIKLSRELSKRATGKTLYLLDEPTTGLHFEDVRKLLEVLHTLVERGNTVVVIEHNLDVIKTADHLIDLGPEGGEGGGWLGAAGTPEEVAVVDASHTGRFLARSLARKSP